MYIEPHKTYAIMKFSLALLFSVCSTILFAQDIEFKPVPSWVNPIESPEKSNFSKYDISSGSYISLYDMQVNLDEEADFMHQTINIISTAGITSASQIYISYDSSYQKIDFHYLYIWRNGKKIDRTEELSFEPLTNENNLDAGIYTGLITAYDILEDIRKDDKIEYAYTLVGDNPIFENSRYRFLPLENNNPVDLLYIRLLTHKNNYWQYRISNKERFEIKEYTEKSHKNLEIEQKDIEACFLEETSPVWHIPYAYFEVSSNKNWEEISNWAASIFTLTKAQDYTEVFNDYVDRTDSKEKQINDVINFVQNDIRYMGIESGIGSIKPYSPNEVLSQRFGDCKDKSLLLVELLKEMGIKEAYPALVSTTMQHGIDNLLPTGHLFDHCIVYFKHDEKPYWIDPTQSSQGGNYTTKVAFDYGKALIVKQGEKSLHEMHINDTISKTIVYETLDISDFNKPGTLKVVTELYGANADFMRNILEYYSLKEVTEQFKSMYAPLFPNIYEEERIRIKDDTENNILTLTEWYILRDLWNEGTGINSQEISTAYEPVNLYSYISYITCDEKKNPIQVPYPSRFVQTTEIKLPNFLFIHMEPETINNPAFRFSKTTKLSDLKTIVLNYNYRAITKEITPQEFLDVCNDMNAILRKINIKLSFPKPKNWKE